MEAVGPQSGPRRGDPGRARRRDAGRARARRRLARPVPRRHRGGGRHPVDRGLPAPRAAGDRRPRARHDHRGRGLGRGRHPSDHRVAEGGPSRWWRPRSTTAASPSTRTCSPSSDGTAPAPGAAPSASGRRLRQLADLPVTVLRGVGRARPATSPSSGSAPSSTCSPTTRAATSTAPGWSPSTAGRRGEGDGAGRRCAGCSAPPARRAAAAGRRPGWSSTSPTAAGGCGWSSSTRRGGPASSRWGPLALFFGPVDHVPGRAQMVNPTVEVLRAADESATDDDGPSSGRIYPVYPLTEKAALTSARIGRLVHEALDRAGPFADPLDDGVRAGLGLLDRTAAFAGIHRPTTMAEVEPARRRLAFDELLRLQLALVLRRQRLHEDARGIAHATTRPDGPDPGGAVRRPAALPPDRRPSPGPSPTWPATSAGPLPMHRLLQGDVGSGKTVVAVAALLIGGGGRPPGRADGADRGPGRAARHRGAAPASTASRCPDPTTLARRAPAAGRPAHQPDRRRRAGRHPRRAGRRHGRPRSSAPTPCSPTDVRLRLAGRGGDRRAAPLRRRAAGGPARQGPGRGRQGSDPDLLVMTATPIPRTAAMVVFGDLDMTVIDELPPGRRPWTPRGCGPRSRPRRPGPGCASRWRPGHRAFVVCPLVEGSERVEAASATAEAERLADHELAGLRVGLLHGQMKAADKEQAMETFRAGELDVLVATTVIEVGCRRARRLGDGDRGRRPLRHRPAPPAAGPGRPWRRAGVVLPAVRVPTRPRPTARLEAMERQHRRLRPGRRRPRPARGGDHPRRPPEGALRPEAGPPAVRPGPGRRRPRRWPSTWWRPTRTSTTTGCWSRSCGSSSTTTRPSSCSRADGSRRWPGRPGWPSDRRLQVKVTFGPDPWVLSSRWEGTQNRKGR